MVLPRIPGCFFQMLFPVDAIREVPDLVVAVGMDGIDLLVGWVPAADKPHFAIVHQRPRPVPGRESREVCTLGQNLTATFEAQFSSRADGLSRPSRWALSCTYGAGPLHSLRGRLRPRRRTRPRGDVRSTRGPGPRRAGRGGSNPPTRQPGYASSRPWPPPSSPAASARHPPALNSRSGPSLRHWRVQS